MRPTLILTSLSRSWKSVIIVPFICCETNSTDLILQAKVANTFMVVWQILKEVGMPYMNNGKLICINQYIFFRFPIRLDQTAEDRLVVGFVY